MFKPFHNSLVTRLSLKSLNKLQNIIVNDALYLHIDMKTAKTNKIDYVKNGLKLINQTFRN